MSKDVAIGIDIGGTDVKFGLVTRLGEVVAADRMPSETRDGPEGLARVLSDVVAASRVSAREERRKIVAVGVGIPGTVTGRRGLVLTAPPQIPGIEGWQVGTALRRLAEVPAAVENDATVAGLAEARVGAGQNGSTVLMVTVGTGLGGALVVGGKLVRGRFGTGGEIGHAVFVPDGEACPHGGRGCLELYTSATALVRYYRDAGGVPGREAREIVQEGKRGDLRCREALARVGRNLGLGLSAQASVLAPDLIILGGGVAEAGRLLSDPAREAFDAQSLPYVSRGVRWTRARLRNRAGVVGAALLAFEEGI